MNAPQDREAQLREFAQEEARRLGIPEQEHYVEDVDSNDEFFADDIPYTTLWVSGLSLAHDQLVVRGLRGLGSQVEMVGGAGPVEYREAAG